MSPEAQPAEDWLARFERAWNTGDQEQLRAELNYPHVTVGPTGQLVVAPTPARSSSTARGCAPTKARRAAILAT